MFDLAHASVHTCHCLRAFFWESAGEMNLSGDTWLCTRAGRGLQKLQLETALHPSAVRQIHLLF